jgi:hypothetical protein
MGDKQPLTLQQAVEQALAQVDGPITADEFFRQVLILRPSKAKKPTAALRNHIRWNEAGKTLVFLDAQTVLPLRVAMRGVRFRIPLSPQEAKRGVLFIHPAFDYFLLRQLDHEKVQLLDQEGRPLPVRVISIQGKVRSVFGTNTVRIWNIQLGRELG